MWGLAAARDAAAYDASGHEWCMQRQTSQDTVPTNTTYDHIHDESQQQHDIELMCSDKQH